MILDTHAEDACLAALLHLWESTAEGMRPESVWVAEHQPISVDVDNPTTPVVKAWFLDKQRGMQPRPPSDYMRFVNVHSMAPPPNAVFNSRPGRIHEIGLAAFAPVDGSHLIYVHYIWGGTFGRGSHYRFASEAGTLAWVQDLWVS